jgi:hypothetical protein
MNRPCPIAPHDGMYVRPASPRNAPEATWRSTATSLAAAAWASCTSLQSQARASSADAPERASPPCGRMGPGGYHRLVEAYL